MPLPSNGSTALVPHPPRPAQRPQQCLDPILNRIRLSPDRILLVEDAATLELFFEVYAEQWRDSPIFLDAEWRPSDHADRAGSVASDSSTPHCDASVHTSFRSRWSGHQLSLLTLCALNSARDRTPAKDVVCVLDLQKLRWLYDVESSSSGPRSELHKSSDEDIAPVAENHAFWSQCAGPSEEVSSSSGSPGLLGGRDSALVRSRVHYLMSEVLAPLLRSGRLHGFSLWTDLRKLAVSLPWQRRDDAVLDYDVWDMQEREGVIMGAAGALYNGASGCRTTNGRGTTVCNIKGSGGAGAAMKSLQKQVHERLGLHLSKDWQLSNWEERPLGQSQLEYAALDAWVLARLYERDLEKKLPLKGNKGPREGERWSSSSCRDVGRENGPPVAQVAPSYQRLAGRLGCFSLFHHVSPHVGAMFQPIVGRKTARQSSLYKTLAVWGPAKSNPDTSNAGECTRPQRYLCLLPVGAKLDVTRHGFRMAENVFEHFRQEIGSVTLFSPVDNVVVLIDTSLRGSSLDLRLNEHVWEVLAEDLKQDQICGCVKLAFADLAVIGDGGSQTVGHVDGCVHKRDQPIISCGATGVLVDPGADVDHIVDVDHTAGAGPAAAATTSTASSWWTPKFPSHAAYLAHVHTLPESLQNKLAALPPERRVRFLEFSKRWCAKSAVYGNYSLLAPDGCVLAKCDEKKVAWYLRRGLADRVSDKDKPLSIQLRFNPEGRKHYDLMTPDELAQQKRADEFYVKEKSNMCVCCGAEQNYLRFHVVPTMYRKHFPEEFKSHSSHDVVLLCVVCQERAQKSQQVFHRELAVECGVGLERPAGVGVGWKRGKKSKCLAGGLSSTTISGTRTPAVQQEKIVRFQGVEDQEIDEAEVRRAALALAKDLRADKIPAARWVELKTKIPRGLFARTRDGVGDTGGMPTTTSGFRPEEEQNERAEAEDWRRADEILAGGASASSCIWNRCLGNRSSVFASLHLESPTRSLAEMKISALQKLLASPSLPLSDLKAALKFTRDLKTKKISPEEEHGRLVVQAFLAGASNKVPPTGGGRGTKESSTSCTTDEETETASTGGGDPSEAVRDLVLRWRRHFLASMEPKHLPAGWHLDAKSSRAFGKHSKFQRRTRNPKVLGWDACAFQIWDRLAVWQMGPDDPRAPSTMRARGSSSAVSLPGVPLVLSGTGGWGTSETAAGKFVLPLLLAKIGDRDVRHWGPSLSGIYERVKKEGPAPDVFVSIWPAAGRNNACNVVGRACAGNSSSSTTSTPDINGEDLHNGSWRFHLSGAPWVSTMEDRRILFSEEIFYPGDEKPVQQNSMPPRELQAGVRVIKMPAPPSGIVAEADVVGQKVVEPDADPSCNVARGRHRLQSVFVRYAEIGRASPSGEGTVGDSLLMQLYFCSSADTERDLRALIQGATELNALRGEIERCFIFPL